jgi:hypothetical protein
MIFDINDIQHNETQHASIECHYTECRDYLNDLLSVVTLNVVTLSVVMLNDVLLSVLAPEGLEVGNIFQTRHST